MNEDTKETNNQQAGQSGDPAETLKKERDEYLNGWKRAKADLMNFQKEETRRFQEVAAFATLSLVKEILAGMDSFDLALSSTKDEETRKGLMMIRGQFDEILKRQGVTRIAVAKGAPPDPKLHEAIQEIEVSGKEAALDGKMMGELVAGYLMGERVIRASKVSIGKLSV